MNVTQSWIVAQCQHSIVLSHHDGMERMTLYGTNLGLTFPTCLFTRELHRIFYVHRTMNYQNWVHLLFLGIAEISNAELYMFTLIDAALQ